MKKTLSLLLLSLLLFPVPYMLRTFAEEPYRPLYWCYRWIGMIDSIPGHGNNFDYYYRCLKPYEKNGKIYNTMTCDADCVKAIFMKGSTLD